MNQALIKRAQSAAKTMNPQWRPTRLAFAPGRLELLGNHLDYNGGKVLAAAIDRQTIVLASESLGDHQEITAVFADFPTGTPAILTPSLLQNWKNQTPPPRADDYLRGAIAALGHRPQLGLRVPLQIAVAGDVPIGFGLSSSAALCVALTLALTQHRPSPKETVLTAQEAEHRAGTPCGTMDQFASVSGGVILYDANLLKAVPIQPNLGSYVFAVADSGVDRSLATSSYPIRVKEAQEMLDIARQRLGRDIGNLAALTRTDLSRLRQDNQVPNTLLKRATHVVTEVERVDAGLQALSTENWPEFGRLMTASGRSSAIDYEISHPRVEELVQATREVRGVLGARMMGGGEGGSVLILVERTALPQLESHLRVGYYTKYGMEQRSDLVYAFQFAEGASVSAIDPAATE